MAELSVADRDAALSLLFGGTLYMGLARDDAGDEEPDTGYKRRPVKLSEPQGEDGVRFVTNVEPILFPEYRRDATKPVKLAILCDLPQGGTVKWSDRLQQPQQLNAGGILFFAAGQFRIGIP